jgi:hypothetical protein
MYKISIARCFIVFFLVALLLPYPPAVSLAYLKHLWAAGFQHEAFRRLAQLMHELRQVCVLAVMEREREKGIVWVESVELGEIYLLRFDLNLSRSMYWNDFFVLHTLLTRHYFFIWSVFSQI